METIKRNAVLIYYPFLDGTSTSLIDSFYNLRNYIGDIDCYICFDSSYKNVKQNVEYIKTLNQSIPMDLLNPIYIDINKLSDFAKGHEFNNLIISFGIFRFLNKLPFQYNQMIILDSGRIIYDFYNQNKKFINYVKSLPNTIVLGNKMNQKFFDWDRYFVYYHKFSAERFSWLKKLENKDVIVDSAMRQKTGNMPFEKMLARELHYYRWRNVTNDSSVFSENIGKMIFEFSALEKKVFYSPLNKTHDDGLTEYLALFGINDNIEQEIKITEEQLFNKLGFKHTDLLLKKIKESN